MIPDGRLVVDASVAVKWYVPEVSSAKASAILQRPAELLAPDLLVPELGNVLWKKARKGELQGAEATEIAEAFVSACPVTLHASSAFLPAALEIATAFQRSVYDSLYLALALAEGCPLVTADQVLRNALRGTQLEQLVLLLDE